MAGVSGAAGAALKTLGIDLGVSPGNMSLGLNSVYMGKNPSRTVARGASGEMSPKGVSTIEGGDNILSLEDAKVLPGSWDQKTMDNFIHQGVIRKVPGFSPDMGLDQVMDKWDDLVRLSSEFAGKGLKISPMDIMNSYRSREGETIKKGNWLYDAVTGEPVKYVGPTSKTSTSTRFDLSTREDALALAKTSMAQMLGRMPTGDEVARYMNLLNGYEKAHPEQSTTTTQISPETGEEVSSSTTSTGGVTNAGRQAVLEENMQQGKEYGAYQAATTYYSAMMQELMRGY